jgi:hypothetical protein
VAYLPKARTVKPQKCRNTHAIVEVPECIARCLVTHATVERVAAPGPAALRSLLRNAELNTSLRQLVARQQHQPRDMFSVRSALTNSTIEFCVLSALRLYNVTLGIFAASSVRASMKPVPVQFSAGDRHGEFVVEGDCNSEL